MSIYTLYKWLRIFHLDSDKCIVYPITVSFYLLNIYTCICLMALFSLMTSDWFLKNDVYIYTSNVSAGTYRYYIASLVPGT